MSDDDLTLSDLGEAGIVQRAKARFGPPPPGETWAGDDAAVIKVAAGHLLFTTDLLDEGRDFELSWATPYDVGWKAVAVNVSDIAAMGGRPTYGVTTLMIRPDARASVVDGLLEGLGAAASRWGASLVGGDISSSDRLSIGIAMLGVPVGDQAVLRSGAAPGDAICVTGVLGEAAVGLALLRSGRLESDGGAAAGLIAKHLRPEARVDAAAALCGIGVGSMIDVSDGLAIDLDRLMAANGAGCDATVGEDARVDPAGLGLDVDAEDLALLGGEDLELLFTIPEARLEAALDAVRAAGGRGTPIGRVTRGSRILNGRALEDWKERAWDHLRNR